MENVIVILILVAIATAIIWYLIRAKKRGDKCIGCPHAKLCNNQINGKCDGKCNGGRKSKYTIKNNIKCSRCHSPESNDK
jgi:hypothetical protein